jgi:hypothetical protein
METKRYQKTDEKTGEVAIGFVQSKTKGATEMEHNETHEGGRRYYNEKHGSRHESHAGQVVYGEGDLVDFRQLSQDGETITNSQAFISRVFWQHARHPVNGDGRHYTIKLRKGGGMRHAVDGLQLVLLCTRQGRVNAAHGRTGKAMRKGVLVARVAAASARESHREAAKAVKTAKAKRRGSKGLFAGMAAAKRAAECACQCQLEAAAAAEAAIEAATAAGELREQQRRLLQAALGMAASLALAAAYSAGACVARADRAVRAAEEIIRQESARVIQTSLGAMTGKWWLTCTKRAKSRAEERRRVMELEEAEEAEDEAVAEMHRFLRTVAGKAQFHGQRLVVQKRRKQEKRSRTSLDSREAQHKAEVRGVFEEFSVGEQGGAESRSGSTMGVSEFRELMRELCVPMTEEVAADAFDKADADHDGHLDFEEFFAWWSSPEHQMQHQAQIDVLMMRTSRLVRVLLGATIKMETTRHFELVARMKAYAKALPHIRARHPPPCADAGGRAFTFPWDLECFHAMRRRESDAPPPLQCADELKRHYHEDRVRRLYLSEMRKSKSKSIVWKGRTWRRTSQLSSVSAVDAALNAAKKLKAGLKKNAAE